MDKTVQFDHLCEMALATWLFQICWIGVCAVSMLYATAVLVGDASPGAASVGFVFCATAFAYGFSAKGIRNRLAWGIGSVCAFFLLRMGHAQQAAVLPAALVWLSYHGMVGPGPGLRRYAVAKPLSIALVWAITTVLLPLPAEKWLPGGFLFLGRACFVFALALAYDLCDLWHDRRHGFTTLVQQLGLRKTHRLMDATLVLAAGCAGVNCLLGFFNAFTLGAIWLSLGVSAWTVWYVPSRMAWGIWRRPIIDGLMILQATTVLLATR